LALAEAGFGQARAVAVMSSCCHVLLSAGVAAVAVGLIFLLL